MDFGQVLEELLELAKASRDYVNDWRLFYDTPVQRKEDRVFEFIIGNSITAAPERLWGKDYFSFPDNVDIIRLIFNYTGVPNELFRFYIGPGPLDQNAVNPSLPHQLFPVRTDSNDPLEELVSPDVPIHLPKGLVLTVLPEALNTNLWTVYGWARLAQPKGVINTRQ